MREEGHSPPIPSIREPWAAARRQVLRRLGVRREEGLSSAQAASRLRSHGPNRLRETRRRGLARILLAQFGSLVVLLLVAAAALSFAFGENVEGAAIVAVILVNSGIGFLMEERAVRSMRALREVGRVEATARRDGTVRRLPAEDLVPGDVVIFEGGDIITADVRILEASNLEADESTLTGESTPVSKSSAAVEADRPLTDRSSMLYKGTAISHGSGEGVVVSTGMDTELGRISSLVEGAEPSATPLQKRLDAFGRRLVWLTLGIAALVAVAGLLGHRRAFLVIETAIALAVATVPEGLPIVATIALARGMWRMAGRSALVERLAAVETLGSITLILADKTGTLTENRMTVVRVLSDGLDVEVGGRGLDPRGAFTCRGEPLDAEDLAPLRDALRVGVLCNNAVYRPPEVPGGEPDAVGEPTEVALLVAGAKAGVRREAVLEKMAELREEAFDSSTMMMATFHETERGVLVAVKGAPESVLERCVRIRTPEGDRHLGGEERDRWLERCEDLAGQGYRLLAAADRTAAGTDEDPYAALTLLAVFVLLDPPREEVRGALRACRDAGIRVVMVTGDHPSTARNVAENLELLERGAGRAVVTGSHVGRGLGGVAGEAAARAGVLARVSPEQKLELIALHQERGEIVAMTGDGVNDAPALKKADIGIAMGRRGTQVAKEAADMVLLDDSFATIVAAVEQGRAIFDNIRKFVLYLLSCNVAEILVVGAASAVNAPLPILPLQILYLNLVTDVFPALALGVGEGSPGLMLRPPRPTGEPILLRKHWIAIAGYGALFSAAVLASLALAWTWIGLDRVRAVTVSFMTLATIQLWHVLDMRDPDSGTFRNEITRNPWIWGALALCAGLLAAAVHLPVLSRVLKLEDPGPAGWAIVAGAGILPVLAVEVGRTLLSAWRRRI